MDFINSGSEVVDVFFGTLYGMDYGIGRIIAQLEQSGELENTIIMFCSDNGMGRNRYNQGFKAEKELSWTKFGNYQVPVPGNGPLNGCKWSVFEGGHRVPLIVYVPGMQGGKKITGLTSIMDLVPTAFDFLDVELPVDNTYDGISFLPLLEGKNMTDNRVLLWACDAREPYNVLDERFARVIKNQYEEDREKAGTPVSRYCLECTPPAWYVIKDNWKLMGISTLKPTLINLNEDLSETTDLSNQYPEKVSELFFFFEDWLGQMEKPVIYPEKQWSKLFRINKK
jgi:uncharacterized sulfatase